MLDFTDSHCHLNHPDLAGETDDVLRRAESLGIHRFLSIGTRLSDADDLIALTRKYPNVFATVAVHPEYVSEPPVSVEDIIATAQKDPKIVAIGEAGLDYHYDPEHRDEQCALFEKHLIAARDTGLPIVIHTREAEDDTIALLKKYPSVTGVLHCFSSNRKLADFGMEQGFCLSASGILTFKKAEDIRAVFKDVPATQILVETDAPYLAPIPYRGRRNEPSFMIKTAEMLAEIKGMTLQSVSDATTANFLSLFKKAF